MYKLAIFVCKGLEETFIDQDFVLYIVPNVCIWIFLYLIYKSMNESMKHCDKQGYCINCEIMLKSSQFYYKLTFIIELNITFKVVHECEIKDTDCSSLSILWVR